MKLYTISLALFMAILDIKLHHETILQAHYLIPFYLQRRLCRPTKNGYPFCAN